MTLQVGPKAQTSQERLKNAPLFCRLHKTGLLSKRVEVVLLRVRVVDLQINCGKGVVFIAKAFLEGRKPTQGLATTWCRGDHLRLTFSRHASHAISPATPATFSRACPYMRELGQLRQTSDVLPRRLKV